MCGTCTNKEYHYLSNKINTNTLTTLPSNPHKATITMHKTAYNSKRSKMQTIVLPEEREYWEKWLETKVNEKKKTIEQEKIKQLKVKGLEHKITSGTYRLDSAAKKLLKDLQRDYTLAESASEDDESDGYSDFKEVLECKEFVDTVAEVCWI